MEIRTFKDLEQFIYQLCQEQESHYTRSLEEYLRSLLVVFQKHTRERVSGNLIARVLTESFTTEPMEFDSNWLAYTKGYFGWGYEDGGYVLKELIGTQTREVKRGVTDIQLLREVILIQVADLYRMRGTSGPADGGYSPGGNIWNNVAVFVYLRTGISGMKSHSSEDEGFQDCDWGCLALLLETGRLME